jgi:L-cystine uptake protein TcyP (sodium:dicarboxylate symporter family)
MPELGFVVFLVAMSYGMGVLWYTLLGRNYTGWMRMVAFPLVGLVIGEALWGKYLSGNMGAGLVFYDLHIYVALISTFIATLVDLAFSWLSREHPIADTFKGFMHTQQPSSR